MNVTLSAERVGRVFASLSGEEPSEHEALCVAATNSIRAMLKGGRDYLSREAELIYAAACLAFYRYTLAKQSEGMSGYKAGDITIKSDILSASKTAKALLDDALAAIADCIYLSGFRFKTV